jgi:RHS repeat-associated protein
VEQPQYLITSEYIYLNGQSLTMIAGQNTYYYHPDHLATPQKITDSSGAIVWSADYKPFGEAAVTVSTIPNNLRFPGQYYDAETGLNYNYFRDYNPAIGRYMESDPLGTRNGANLYAYVSDNPAMGIDPRGLINIFTLNHQYVLTGPQSCGHCEQRIVIREVTGYATLGIDPTTGAEGPWFFIAFPQPYYTGTTYACIPTCCKKTNDVTQTGTGPVTPQNWYINNVFTFTWTANYAQFDCSDCQSPCNKCK